MGKKYRMSSAQMRLFAMYEVEKGNIAYNIPSLYKLEGDFNVEKLNDALKEMVCRHEILRTHFAHYKDNFVQEVEDEWTDINVGYEVVDDCNIDEEMQKFVQPFDLGELPLLRMKIIKDDKVGAGYLLFDIHHIICDGESMNIFFDELAKLYEGSNLPKLNFQYKNYSSWEQKQDLEKQESYWIEEFKDATECLELRTDCIRPAWKTSNGSNFEISLDKDIKNEIQLFCTEKKVTEYMFFMAAFVVLLEKYTGQNDIVIGSPVLGRTHPDAKDLIGMFVNTVAIRNKVNSCDTFETVLREVEKKSLQAFDNQDYQFEELVQKLEITRDNSRNPIFDVLFGLQNGGTEMIQMGDIYLSPVKIKSDVSKFDVTLMVDSNPDQYILYWEYNSDLFLNTTIERMASHYVILLQNILRYSDEKIEDIDYISVNEKNELVDDIISEEVKQYEKETLIGQFEKCVKRFPDNIAIEYADRMITYEELNQFADNVATDLRERDCGVGDIIGIWADTSCERIAAVLGVLKTGAAYMPIDIDAPIDRIKYMMKNSGAKYILRDADIEGNLDSGIVTLDLQQISCKEMTYTHEEYSSDVPAYLIYTSGSTGNPKGVLVNNKNIVNQVYWHIKGAKLDEKSIFVQNTAFIFDGSVLEIFSSLLSGGRLRLINSDEKKEPEKIIEKMENAYINILPSMFRAVMEYAIANGEEKKLNSFKHLGLVAEKIPEDLIERYIRTESSDLSRIWNLYGPTETTITATFYHLNSEMDFKHVPIGYPVTNYRIYILRGDRLCGHGVVGEICISGVGVSCGYINNKELTDKVFVKNLFGSGNMYRTGDTGYINEKNEIVILGRVDEQVKVRGFRVELQEIEKQIMSVDEVKEAVVVCKKDSANNYLVAYYEGDVSATKVQIAISDFLPSYMVPEYIISLDEIPHLPNGKIDKKSLETREIKKKAGLGKPKTEVEKLICGIYEEVLGIETVGRDDNFFEVGGDSIKAIRIVSKLRNAGYDMSVKKVMQLASPKLIAKTLSKISSAQDQEEEQVSGKVRLAPIQKRFFETKLPNPNHFNQSAIFTSSEPINITAVNNSLQCLVKHHDQLRATFNEQDQVISAQIDEKQYAAQLYNIKNENLEKALQRIGNELQTNISIKDNKLINCAIVESSEMHALILCIHHLIIDAVSWEILVEDLNELYSGFVDNKKIKLSNKTLSYKQWTDTLNDYYLDGKHKEELEFWKETVTKLRKSDEVELRERLNRSKEFTIIMPQEVVKPIIENGRKILSMNANELLLAIFLRSFSECMNTKGTSFMIESHGRPELDERLAVTRTIGWFTTLYPIVFECVGQDYMEDLRTTKETLRSIPNYGIGYDIARDSGFLAEEFKEPLITFNYFGNRETQNVINSLPLIPDNYDIGLNIDENNKFGTPISINAELINGDVVAEISYVQGILEEEKITQFKECVNKQAKSLKKLFEGQQIKIMTPSDYYQSNMSLRDWDVIINKMSQQKETLEDIYDLSPMQEGMLYDKLRDADSLNYVLQTVIKYKMFIDNKKMEQAVYQLANVHEILKTHVFYDGITQPKQVIPTERALEYKYKDFSTSEHAYEEFDKLCASEHKKGFQLEKDSLIRFALCRLPSDEFRIVITAHHIIMDGWSLPIIVNDLMDLYTHDYSVDACITKPKYSEYIRQLKSRDSVYNYWRKVLGGIEEKTTILPLKNNREASSIVAEIEMVINDATTKGVEKIIQRYQVTMNTFIEAVWGIILQRYNDVQDAIFGKVVSGRNVDISNVEKMVGLFINTIPVRIQNRPGLKFYELLSEVQTQSMESSEYDNVSLMRLQEELGLGQDSIQTILAFENYFVNDLSEDFGYDVENAKEQTDFDLALAISKEEQLKINL
uniref:non-ribosomal peptide synthetase n=1 Tax=Anaerosporobacter sp. TaxID=1872529 RepID=UPI00286F07A8